MSSKGRKAKTNAVQHHPPQASLDTDVEVEEDASETVSEIASEASGGTLQPRASGELTQLWALMAAMHKSRDVAEDARRADSKRLESQRRADEQARWEQLLMASQDAAKQQATAAEAAQDMARQQAAAYAESELTRIKERAAELLADKERREARDKVLEAKEARRAGRDVPKMAQLGDIEDIELFLSSFEGQMSLYEVPPLYWVAHLLPLLDHASLAYQEQMPAPDKNSFEAVQATLISFHGITPAHYHSRWNKLAYKPGESVHQLTQRTLVTFWAWTKGVSDVGDMMVREKVLSLLPADTQSWVQAQDPPTSSKAAQLADSFLLSRPVKPDPSRRWPSHRQERPPGPTQSGTGPAPKPMVKPENTRLPSYDPVKGYRWFECQQWGHRATNLPLGPKVTIQMMEGTRRCPTTTTHLDLGDIHLHRTVAVQPIHGIDAIVGTDAPEFSELLRQQLDLEEQRLQHGQSESVVIHHGVMATNSEGGVNVDATPEVEGEGPNSDEAWGGDVNDDTPPGVEGEDPNSDEACSRDVTDDASPDEEEVDDGLPRLGDDLFELFSTKKTRECVQRQKNAQRHSQAWGQPIPLEGGRPQLILAQKEDRTLEICRCQAGVEKTLFFYDDDGILSRKWTHPKQTASITQTVLPKQYRETVLRMAHQAPWAGHFGRTKTGARVLQRLFWPGIRQDVAELCRRCQVCQRTRTNPVRKYPLIPLPVVPLPFHRLAMDMVGPLPTTEEGHRFVLTVCDYGTRYPEAFPLHTTTSKDVAGALVEMFARTGIPAEILMDRGSNFCSELMEELFHLLGVRHVKTSAYDPETDGMVERYNGTLKRGLRKYLDHFGGEWQKALPYLLFAYRELPHAAMGYSPFELLFGHNPRGPLDVLKEQWQDPVKAKESIVSYLRGVYDKLELAQQTATAFEEASKEVMKSAYDVGSRARSFEVDDLVLVLLPTSTNKLLAQWQDPFPITTKLGETTYRVKTGPGAKGERTFHINLLS